MTGKRELILARLNWTLQQIPQLYVTRNETSFSGVGRPIVNQLDGDEDPTQIGFDEQAHSGLARSLIIMTPSVDLMVGDTPERSGPVVNEWRVKITQAVLGDAVKKRPPVPDGSLGWLVGMKGYVKYGGMGSRFTHSYNADADMTIRFSIFTVFDPSNP